MLAFIGRFNQEPLYVKVGMELYYQNGPYVVDRIKSLGHKIFLDLKLHDIPNTVHRAMKGLAGLGIDMVNVHAAGGVKMMAAAKEGLIAGTPAGMEIPKLIAVTQLTSTSQIKMQQEQLIPTTLLESVLHYAQLTHSAGLDGVVCSPLEAKAIKEATTSQFLTVTPGIRLEHSQQDDQIRIMTPRLANKSGADYIVVGRPITLADDPVDQYMKIKHQWFGKESSDA